MYCRWLLAVCFLLFLNAASRAQEPKRLLILGQESDGHLRGTHEYATGVEVLREVLAKTPGLEITLRVTPAEEPWPEGPELIENCDAAVLFLAWGGDWIARDPRRQEAFARLAKRGGGISAIHSGIGARDEKNAVAYAALLGGCYGGTLRKDKVAQVKLTVAHPEAEIMRGIKNFAALEEVYYQLLFVEPKTGFQPLLVAKLDGNEEPIAWQYERPDGGRSFGFSGLHFHANWKQEIFRRLVAQGVLWTLKSPIPEDGLAVAVANDVFKLKPPTARR